MSKIKTKIWKLEPHTVAKHILLRKYLNAWIPILTRHHNKVLFIDGFAGPGVYENGEEGSPIIAIKSVLEHKLDFKSKILFFFIEKNKKRYECLENELKKMELPTNISYECECGLFSEVIDKKLKPIEENGSNLIPTFAFIDPFGVSHTPFAIVKRLLKNNRCEVFINFMYDAITRFINNPKYQENYDELFGCDDWQKYKDIKNPKEKLELIHNLYKKQLEKHAKYVRSFKMINKFNKTGYFLFFATNNLLGLKKMKAAMWKVDPSGFFKFSDATYNPNQTLLFEHKPNFVLLKRILIDEFKGKRISIEQLEHFVVVKTSFLETHYKTQILRPMEKNGELNAFRDKSRKKRTYPKGTIIEIL